MAADYNETVQRYIGLVLAYKNCENDLKEFDSEQFKHDLFVPWLLDEIQSMLQQDMRPSWSDTTMGEKHSFKASRFLPFFIEGVMEVMKEDMKLYRGMRIVVNKESESTRIYHWRKGRDIGSIRLTKEQLLKLTSDTCMKYFNDDRVDVKYKSLY